MQKKQINGIQQIGVGVGNAVAAFEWYGTRLGADIPVFDDNNIATYMAPYMGGEPHKKRAIFALNLQGGCGYELWQYLDRDPAFPKEAIAMGDLGICIAEVKSRNIQKSFERLRQQDVTMLSDIISGADGKQSFLIKDPWNNIIRVKESGDWFLNGKSDIGGVFGCAIGVSDIDASRKFYSGILGYDHVIYDETGNFDDFAALPNGNGTFRRVLLTHSADRTGGFSPLFGRSEIELIQAVDNYEPKKIFAGRYWGDIGYIHICFDVVHIDSLMEECADAGFPFTVRSSETFDMGDANGGWGYLEDADGTLIEFVETHRVPLAKKLNIAINMDKRDPKKPLPRLLIKALSFKRTKFKEK